MELINRLPSFSVSQCGLCCEKQYQCESCLKSMLRTAGLDVEKYLSRVKIRKSKNYAYAWNDYSEVIIEMRKIISEQENQ